MDPVTAGILGGTALLSGITSLIGGRKRNKTELLLAREQNALNYKMFQEQNAFNLDMWNRQNEYNTPMAQQNRLLEAGINPTIALGNISTGNAESLLSAGANPAQRANVENELSGLAYGIHSAGSQLADIHAQAKVRDAQAEALKSDSELKKAQAIGEAIKNSFGKQREQMQLDLQKSIKDLNDAKRNESVFSLERLQQMTPLEVQELKTRIDMNVSQDLVNKSVQSLNEYELNHVRPAQLEKLKAETALAWQNTTFLYQQGKLSEAQAVACYQSVVESKARVLNINASTEQIKAFTWPSVDLMISQRRLNSWNEVNAEQNAYNTSARTRNIDLQNRYMPDQEARAWINTTGQFFRDVGIGFSAFTNASGGSRPSAISGFSASAGK